MSSRDSNQAISGVREPYHLLDLFSGIGGFSLGLERTGGFKTAAFCEINPFCRRVLAKHWPGVPILEDVRALEPEQIASLGALDALSAGFPCQGISHIGLRRGFADDRSGLWRDTARVIRRLRPPIVLLENVEALRSRGLDIVLGDLAALGYDCEWDCIPAAYAGAPHPRDRIWLVAYRQGVRRREAVFHVEAPAPSASRQLAGNGPSHGREWQPEPDVGRVVHGLPGRVDRIGALGNAIVPEMAYRLGLKVLAEVALEQRAAA